MARPVAGYGALPTRPQEQTDTEPEPFGPKPAEADTAPRCYLCGNSDGFSAGVSYAIRELRKWLAGRMTGSEAIAIAAKFRDWLRTG